MASYKSRPADYGQYIQPVNLDLVKFVLDSKQQKYDYNLAKLEHKIDNELGSIDLARTEDKQYFLDRANNIMNSLGDTSSIDFSKSDATRQVDNRLSSIVDDRVLGNVISTGNYRSFQKTLQEKQKANDGTYNQLNAAHAMEKQGVNTWLNGDSDNLGGVNYTDYTDVQAEMKEISKTLDDFAHVIKQTTEDGSIYYTTTEGKRLSSAEIQNIAKQHLSDKAKHQITINGWGKYDAGNPEAQAELLNTFGEFSQSKLKHSQTSIDSLTLRIDSLGNTNPERVAQLKAERVQATSTLNNDTELYQKWLGGKNYDAMSSTLEATSVYQNFGDTFEIDDVYTSKSTNTAVLSMMKINAAAAKEANKTADVGAFNISNVGVEDYGERNLLTGLSRKGASYDEELEVSTMQLFNGLSKAQQSGALENYDKDKHGSKYEYLSNYFIDLPGDGVITGREKSELQETLNRRNIAVKSYEDAMNFGFKHFEDSISNLVISEFSDNKNIMIMHGGEKVSVSKLFSEAGITTNKDLNNPKNSTIKKSFLKGYYADKIISEQIVSPKGFEATSMYLPSVAKENYKTRKDLGVEGINIENEQVQRLQKLLNKDVKKGEEVDVKDFLELYIKNELYDTAAFLDNSVTDDSTINKAITLDNVKKSATEYIKNNLFTGANAPKSISFSGDSVMGTELINAYGTNMNNIGEGTMQGKKDKDYVYSVWEASEDSVYIKERINVKGVFTTNTIEVQKENLPPSVVDKVNFKVSEQMYTVDNMEEFEGKVNYSDINNTQASSDNAYFVGSEGLALNALTHQGVKNNLYNSYSHIMGTSNQPSIYGKAIENFIKAGNVVVGTKGNKRDGFQVQISIRTADGGTLPLKTNLEKIPPDLYDDTWRKVTRVPQLYTTMLLNDIMKELTMSPENPGEAMQLILEHYGE